MKPDKTLTNLIKSSQAPSPRSGLDVSIKHELHKLERRSLRIRTSFLGVLSLFSLSALVATFFSLGRTLATSGFSNYLSLIVSDSSIITTYWKEVSLSLVESLPMLSVALLLLALGVFIWSSAKTLSNAKVMLQTA